MRVNAPEPGSNGRVEGGGISVQYVPLGDHVLVMRFPQRISVQISESVHRAARRIRQCAIPGIVQVIPTMAGLAVQYDPFRIGFGELERRLREMQEDADREQPETGKTIRVPVCYGGKYGIDLAEVADRKGLTEEEVVRMHCGRPYLVYMLGFIAGYPYIGDLDERLSLPRRATPRISMEQGSVVIANRLTVIQPIASPGGWHMIGRTPLSLFDPLQSPPCLILAGDTVRFEPIGEREFQLWDAGAQHDWMKSCTA